YRWVILIGITAAMALVLYLMGREPICTCGYIKLWHGVVFSSENSQHVLDWYTFTHVVHGLAVYFLLSLFGKRLTFWQRLLIAAGLEAGWEILENTDMVIERYRAVTISLDYYGDSIINSVGDIIAMLVGFWFAGKRPAWQSVVLFFALEIALLVGIR